MSEYALRPVGPDHEPAVLDLLARALGEKAGRAWDAAFWRWKHVDGPFGASHVLGAYAEDGTLAALRTMLRWRFETPDGAAVAAVRAVDTATHPEHRRRGLFKTLTLRAIEALAGEGAAFVFNTPNAQSRPGYLRMGWSVVTEWPVLARPTRRLPAALLGRAADPWRGLEPWAAVRARHGGALADLVGAHERGRAAVGYRTPRTPGYLDWRYGAHPSVRYGAYVVEQNGRLEGLAVARPVTGFRGLPALLVTELFVCEPSPRAVAALLRSLARGTGCAYVTAHATEGTVERAALRRSGFVRLPGRGYVFTARALGDVPLDPLAAGSWDLTLSELEIF